MNKNNNKNKRTRGKVVPLDPALRKSRSRRRPYHPPTEEVKNLYRPTRKPKKSKRTRGRQTENLKEYKRGMSIRRSTTVVAVLFFVFVLAYLIRSLFAFFTTPDIPVNMVQMGSIDTPTVIEGIIIRDETVYNAPRSGVLQFAVNNYDRVRPGVEVASIQNVDAVVDIQRSIYEVEERILVLQDIRGNLSAVDPAIHQINSQIRNIVDSRLSRHVDLNMSDVYSLRDSIAQNVNIRNRMIVSENLDANVRAELNVQHSVLLGELDANRTPIYIGGGGIVSPVVDGFEEILTFENRLTLTREQTRQNVDFNQIIPSQEIEYGSGAFKIINSNHWYIAAYIPNELVEGLAVGANASIYIEGRRGPLTVRVDHIEPWYQESFVIFRSNAYMIDFLNTRSIFFRTADTLRYGLRIANTAFTKRAVQSGVESADGSALESVLYEGEYEVGVFRVNNGIAAFVPVYLPEDTPVGSVYTILDPALNPALRVHDHIVTNASLVEEGDIVFSGVR